MSDGPLAVADTTTSEPPIVAEAKGYVRLIADELTAPREGEAFCCYLAQLLEEFRCDGTYRHTVRFRDAQASRAAALLQRLRTAGGYCDCEVLPNVFECAEAAAPTVLVDEDGFGRGRSARVAGIVHRRSPGFGASL